MGKQAKLGEGFLGGSLRLRGAQSAFHGRDGGVVELLTGGFYNSIAGGGVPRARTGDPACGFPFVPTYM